MKKKLITCLLAASLAVTSLAACGKQEEVKSSEPAVEKESSSQQSTQESAPVETIENFNAEGYPIVNEEITLKVMLRCRDTDTLVNPDDMPAIKRLEEQTGINLEWNVVKAGDWDTKLNLTFASEDYPDIIIAGNGVDDEEYGVDQGIIIPMTDLIEKYMPNVSERAAMTESPYLSILASDGEIYAVPQQLGGSSGTDYFWFINQDWLNALKLDMPTDIESLTEVLRAFKTGDPNGNGEQDEIPMTYKPALVFLVNNLFGVPQDGNYVFIDDNKQVQFVPEQEGFRKAMEWLHMLYEEGILDPEALTQDSNTLKAKIAEGNVGFSLLYRLTNMGYDKSEKCMTLWVPSEEDGSKLYSNIAFPTAGVYFTSTNPYPEASARLINAMLELETMMSLYWGEQDNEAYGWEYDPDGRLIRIGTTPTTAWDYLGVNGVYYAPAGYYGEHINSGSTGEERANYNQRYSEAGVLNKYGAGYLFQINLDTEDQEQLNLIKTDINTTMSEWMTTFIVEGVTDSSYKEMLDIFKSIGSEKFKEFYQKGIDQLDIK